MMLVQFNNVTITVQAKTKKEAYTLLCNALSTLPGHEWTTDTYHTEGMVTPRSTVELFPGNQGGSDETV